MHMSLAQVPLAEKMVILDFPGTGFEGARAWGTWGPGNGG